MLRMTQYLFKRTSPLSAEGIRSIMAQLVLFWHKVCLWTALTLFFELQPPMLVSQQHHSKQSSYQRAAENQNVYTLVKTAGAAEDSGLDPLLMCFAVVWFTHWSASGSHQLRSWPFLVLPIAAYSSNDWRAKNMQVLWKKKKKISINTTFWYQFARF